MPSVLRIRGDCDRMKFGTNAIIILSLKFVLYIIFTLSLYVCFSRDTKKLKFKEALRILWYLIANKRKEYVACNIRWLAEN